MASSAEDGIPNEMKKRLAAFDTALTQLETTLQPFVATTHVELAEKLKPLDMGKMDLIAAYTVNSLFWMYLNVNGVNPKEHSVKQELERIRSYMNRVKEIQDKAKAPKVDKGAAKRFVKSALWQAAQKKSQSGEDKEARKVQTPLAGKKRKSDTSMEHQEKQKKSDSKGHIKKSNS